MSNVLRVGIVGCGEVARVWHIPPLLKIRGVEIAAVCDMNEQAAKQAAERIGTGSYYVDISDMLRREKLDIVDICTSPRSHTPLCIEALEAGCHVLVEKPIALSTQEADEMRVIVEGDNGLGTIALSCNWPKGESTIDIFGTRRNLHISLRSALLTRYGSGGASGLWRGLDNLNQGYQHLVCTAAAAFNTMLGRYNSGHHTLISRFIDSVRDNTEPPVTGEEGREVVRQMEIIVAGMSGAA